jgi:hypothetical protein
VEVDVVFPVAEAVWVAVAVPVDVPVPVLVAVTVAVDVGQPMVTLFTCRPTPLATWTPNPPAVMAEAVKVKS